MQIIHPIRPVGCTPPTASDAARALFGAIDKAATIPKTERLRRDEINTLRINPH
jgi:hypothetical protein